jgi:hypothetical protein
MPSAIGVPLSIRRNLSTESQEAGILLVIFRLSWEIRAFPRHYKVAIIMKQFQKRAEAPRD